ncbi:MAG: hypothetical protein CL569_04920 [Alphaproteobacteria bacterium]|nr:hypothetical protein [Alphaproteobacteria bacterium]|tara:strand:+ start:2539 stop:3384 length:846 start_codon:yes stop_codon:yes gene_type:complete
MAANYIVPLIYILLPGHDCRVRPAYASLGQCLIGGSGRLIVSSRVYHDGVSHLDEQYRVEFRDGQLVGGAPETLHWPGQQKDLGSEPGYWEIGFQAEDEAPIVANTIAGANYASYRASGKRLILADPPLKYASPPTIDQIAAYGQFVDGCVVTRIDRKRNFGESIALLNPYNKPILASVFGHDEQKLRRIRVPAQSGRFARLAGLLRESEDRWVGQVQLTATNRLCTYNVKHAFDNPADITHCEHLDSFRADPTHMPAFQMLRQQVGWFLARRGVPLHKLR